MSRAAAGALLLRRWQHAKQPQLHIKQTQDGARRPSNTKAAKACGDDFVEGGEMRRSEFDICHRADGKPWVLGHGSFGTVRAHVRVPGAQTTGCRPTLTSLQALLHDVTDVYYDPHA